MWPSHVPSTTALPHFEQLTLLRRTGLEAECDHRLHLEQDYQLLTEYLMFCSWSYPWVGVSAPLDPYSTFSWCKLSFSCLSRSRQCLLLAVSHLSRCRPWDSWCRYGSYLPRLTPQCSSHDNKSYAENENQKVKQEDADAEKDAELWEAASSNVERNELHEFYDFFKRVRILYRQ